MKYRTIFISDSHLGMPASKADLLFDFLEKNDAEELYLVGDILDMWVLRRKVNWPKIYTELFRLIISKFANIVYTPGNHDEFFQEFDGYYGHVEVAERIIHRTARGERLLVLHGHQFDSFSSRKLSDTAYGIASLIDRWLRRIGYAQEWSFAHAASTNLSWLLANYYDRILKIETEKFSCNGIVCGHLHLPILKKINGYTYANCGDWVHNCTAIVETDDGELHLVRHKYSK